MKNLPARNLTSRTLLSVSVCMLMHLSMTSHALESMSDDNLRDVSGQDGIAITAELDSATIENATWQDGDQGSVVANNISVTNPTAGDSVKTELTFQTGANTAGVPGLDATLGLGSAQVEVPSLNICDKDGGQCSKLGALAVTNSGSETKFTLVTTNGLFNEEGTAELKAVIDNMTVAVKQQNGSQTNQLMLGNMYANMTADGKLFVTDTAGLKFMGTVSFDKKTLSGSERDGLEVLVQHQAGTNTAQTLGKIALTGGMNDVDLSLRGVQGTVTDLGFENGTAGIAMRMSANFNSDLKVKLGDEAGMGLTGWKNIAGVYDATTNPNGSKSFDTGNVYVNVIPSDANVSQTLKVNDRLTLSDSVIQQMKTNADYLTRNFKKERGDTEITPFGTAGTQYISRNGYVIGADGNVIKEFHGLKLDYNQGIVNKDGQYLSVRDTLKDGYVASGNEYVIRGNGNGDGNNARFRTIYTVNTDGSLSELYLSRITDRNPNQTTGGFYWRPNRQVRVWVNQGAGNIVVAPYGSNRNNSGRIGDNVADLGNNNHADAYHKAINLADITDAGNTYRHLSGNNLSNLDFPFTVNSNGEVRNRSGVLLMERHTINELGFIVENSNGSMNTNNNGNPTGNGSYAYEFDYEINASNQLLVKQKDGTVVKTIQLQVFNPEAIQKVTTDDYNITTETTSGDGNSATQAKQNISVNVRDMSMQAYATKTEFFDKSTGTERTDTQNWAVAPVLYAVDANVLLHPKTLNTTNAVSGYTQAGEAIGYKLAATTQGSNGTTDFNQANATRTTGLLVTHDDDNDASKTRYLGLRHVDSLVRSQGDIQITGDGIAITANDFLFAFRAELAAGAMPTAGQTFDTADRLAVIEGRLKGDAQAKIVPVSEGVGFDATLKLSQGATGTNSNVRMVMPDGSASISMSEITGTVKVEGTVDTVNTSSDPTNSFDGALQVKSTMTLNPTNDASQDVRIRNIGFNTRPSVTAGNFDPYQDVRLGQLGFSKNTIYSEVTLSK